MQHTAITPAIIAACKKGSAEAWGVVLADLDERLHNLTRSVVRRSGKTADESMMDDVRQAGREAVVHAVRFATLGGDRLDLCLLRKAKTAMFAELNRLRSLFGVDAARDSQRVVRDALRAGAGTIGEVVAATGKQRGSIANALTFATAEPVGTHWEAGELASEERWPSETKTPEEFVATAIDSDRAWTLVRSEKDADIVEERVVDGDTFEVIGSRRGLTRQRAEQRFKAAMANAHYMMTQGEAA
jgi:hypothetical protein